MIALLKRFGFSECFHAVALTEIARQFRRLAGLALCVICAPFLSAGPALHPLMWDTMEKTYLAKMGETSSEMAFVVTNRSEREVVILRIEPSCGCTIAIPPKHPWRLAPGENGALQLKINFADRYGELIKTVAIDSTAGGQTLVMRVMIPETPTLDGKARLRNVQVALADPQAVFRGECAQCHAAPATGKLGEPLFRAACAICHVSDHRAPMIPDLAQPRKTQDAALWRAIIANGRFGTLMPAFSNTQRGPLTDAQIDSLVSYVLKRFPGEPAQP
jgi:mono/diheme cytochrome c family protein